jgi:drug/metabolite transporter (DMT)-like permease
MRARAMVLLAGALWSLSGLFAKALKNPTVFGVHEPDLPPLEIAAARALFAGALLIPLLKRSRRPPADRLFVGMIVCFAAMNALYMTALTTGAAAIAILLQYTAPLWLLIAGYLWLGETVARRDLLMLTAGLAGIGIIIAGNWAGANPLAVSSALASGVAYAGVVLLLRVQRDRDSAWLTAANLLGTAIVLLPAFALGPTPTARQLVWLALFGAVQLAIPYWLIARALTHVTSFEAGLLTLIEPVLNPVWAWMVAPDAERPTPATLAGGALILAALAARYLRPSRDRTALSPEP